MSPLAWRERFSLVEQAPSEEETRGQGGLGKSLTVQGRGRQFSRGFSHGGAWHAASRAVGGPDRQAQLWPLHYLWHLGARSSGAQNASHRVAAGVSAAGENLSLHV